MTSCRCRFPALDAKKTVAEKVELQQRRTSQRVLVSRLVLVKSDVWWARALYRRAQELYPPGDTRARFWVAQFFVV
jgi:hypothetical protein